MKTDQYISLFSARRLILSLFPVLFVLLLPVHHAQAAENAQKLVVFPFAVNAPDEFSYLDRTLPPCFGINSKNEVSKSFPALEPKPSSIKAELKS